MTKTTLKMVLMLGVLSVLIVSVAGCTTANNTTEPLGAPTQPRFVHANASASMVSPSPTPTPSLTVTRTVPRSRACSAGQP
jgi:hypothetical protein